MTDLEILDAARASQRGDWLAWRGQGLGATDAVAIMGYSRFSSPWSVWAEKVGLIPPDESDNEMAEFGRMFEPAAKPWFHDRTGLHVVGEQTWCTHPDQGNEWARCTPDGFVVEGPNNDITDWLGTFEVKAPFSHQLWQEGLGIDEVGDGRHAPIEYQIQATWQQWVTGTERTWFAVLHGRRFRIYEMAQHGPDVELVVERCRKFWTEHVLTGTPPEVDASDATAAALAEVYPQHTEGAIEVDDLALQIASWRLMKAEAKAIEGDMALVENEIKARLGDVEEGTIGGARSVSWRTQTSRRIDTERVRDFPDWVVEGLTVESKPRVLRYHPPKKAKGS